LKHSIQTREAKNKNINERRKKRNFLMVLGCDSDSDTKSQCDTSDSSDCDEDEPVCDPCEPQNPDDCTICKRSVDVPKSDCDTDSDSSSDSDCDDDHKRHRCYGPQGPQGYNGFQGFVGSQGIAGFQGYIGVQGAVGPQAQVVEGPQGQTGPQGSVSGPQGTFVYAYYSDEGELTVPPNTDFNVPLSNISSQSGGWTLAASQLVVPEAGQYLINYSIGFTVGAQGGNVGAGCLGHNQSSVSKLFAPDENQYLALTFIDTFAANEQVQLIARTNAATPVTIEPNNLFGSGQTPFLTLTMSRIG
jgi:hypothetical protein